MLASPPPPLAFVLDVDGVMTDGRSWYTEAGKTMKVFGPDDHDALCLLRDRLTIHFVTGDRRGLPISEARIVRDMGFPLDAVSTIDRLSWITARWPAERVAYMGDGVFDAPVLRAVAFGVCPADGDADARAAADYVTARRGGDRAVAEACKELMDRFFGGAEAMVRAACAPEAAATVAGGWSDPSGD